MKKKSLVGKLALLSMVLTLVTTSLMSGTLARYTGFATGEGAQGVVAKWAFKAGTSIGGTSITTVDLKDTANSKVASSKIAPGTTGTIPLYIDFTGTEVDVAYKVTAELKAGYTNIPKNLTMNLKINGAASGAVTFTDPDQPVTLTEGTLANSVSSKDITGEIDWSWPYQTDGGAGDLDDNSDGEAANSFVIIFKVTAVQMDRNGSAIFD